MHEFSSRRPTGLPGARQVKEVKTSRYAFTALLVWKNDFPWHRLIRDMSLFTGWLPVRFIWRKIRFVPSPAEVPALRQGLPFRVMFGSTKQTFGEGAWVNIRVSRTLLLLTSTNGFSSDPLVDWYLLYLYYTLPPTQPQYLKNYNLTSQNRVHPVLPKARSSAQ